MSRLYQIAHLNRLLIYLLLLHLWEPDFLHVLISYQIPNNHLYIQDEHHMDLPIIRHQNIHKW